MAKINEIISDAGRTMAKMKASPAKHAGHGKKDHPKHDWEKQEGDYSVGGKAVDYFKSTTPGAYTSQSIEKAKGGGPAPDLNKYLQNIYKRFGDKVTTRELIDKKFIDEAGGKLYDKLTSGKNLGIQGAATTHHKYANLFDQNTSGGEGGTTTTTTNTPGTQDYNMGFRQVQNVNMADAAKRRGNKRKGQRADRDLKTYEQGRKGFLGIGKKEAGNLTANVLTAAEISGRKDIKGLEYEQIANPDYNPDDTTSKKTISSGKIIGDADQRVTDTMRNTARSRSTAEHTSAINKFSPKGPDSTTTIVTGNEGTGEPPTTITSPRLGVEGATDVSQFFTDDDKGSSGSGNIFSNMKLNPDNYKIQGDYSMGSMVSRALKNNPIGVTPSATTTNEDDDSKVRPNIELGQYNAPWNPNKNPISKHKPAYKVKSSGILKKGNHRGAGY